ncbi:MAG: MSMEG_4193 family putative phosphomutase [Actinobacteria bacterium]|nr:MSMEG_4193 family putative phosphomutase [Actinomycetota bacterium]
MGTVLLIRHGQSVANAQGILAGRASGVHLDEHGEKSAGELGAHLSSLPIAKVLVSPLERTQQTADLIFANKFPVEIESRITECDYGDWQGRLLSELSLEDTWKTVQETPDQMIFPNGESMQEMSDRAVAAIREWDSKLSAEHGPDVIWAAVSHGDVIKAICADALNLPLRNFQRISIEPTSVSVVQYRTENAQVHKLNDTGIQWVQALAKIAQSKEATVGGEVTAK